MARVKVTFSLPPETVGLLNNVAERHSMPKSQVVRDAIHDYHARADRLTKAEKTRMLDVLDRLVSREPSRSAKEVDQEIAAIREARLNGGRQTRAE